MKFLAAGDSAIIIELGNEISPLINSKVKKIVEYIDSTNNPYILDLLPTYRSVIIYYDPLKITFSEIEKMIKENCNLDYNTLYDVKKDVVEIPVLYGGEYGPDMANICENAKLSEKEVIDIHSSPEYLIYMLGFMPGFCYLGGMDEKIKTPRLKEPRVKIASGSVGIADMQTGIYPIESPGGWQLLGRTPLKMFDPMKENPFLVSAGEYIKFVPITEEDYKAISSKVETGTYKEKRYRV